VSALADEILERLEAEANPARAALIAAERPTAARLLGVVVPRCHALGAELACRLADASVREVFTVADALIDAGVHEARSVAIDLLLKRRVPLGRATLEHFGRGLDNWESVDHFARLAGRNWRFEVVTDADVAAWAESPDRWWRRLALAATTELNLKSRGGPGDAPATLAVCARLVTDRDPMVVKALSWALRTLAARDPAAVAAFVDARPELPALVRREVRRKLETGRKTRGRAGSSE
jgi:3-methyladenine DNA glycosylase AlkD